MAGILEGQLAEEVVPNKIVMLVVALVIFHLGVLVSFDSHHYYIVLIIMLSDLNLFSGLLVI